MQIGPIFDSKRAKIGPIFDSTAHINISLYIYIYASGLTGGYELISGPGRVNKRARSSETTCFKAWNGERFFRARLRMVKNSRNRTFRKMPFSRHFAHFFGHPSLRPFFPLVLFWLVGRMLMNEVDARNATKQGVSDRFRVCLPLRPRHLLEKASILRTVFNDNFFCVLLFSIFRSSNF